MELNMELEQLLDKSSQLSQQAIGILNGFDHRLGSMHNSLAPLHASTQKLSRVNENVDRLMEQLQTVIEYFDLANGSKAEPQLNEQDFRQFYADVDRIRQAFLFIASTGLKGGDQMRGRLRSILYRAMHKMELLFRKHLTACSGVNLSNSATSSATATVNIMNLSFPPWPNPVDSSQPSSLAAEDSNNPQQQQQQQQQAPATPLIDAEQVETLRSIAHYLSQNELDMAAHGSTGETSSSEQQQQQQHTNYIKVFVEVRSQYLTDLFQPTIKACMKFLDSFGGSGPGGGGIGGGGSSSYQRYSSPFLPFSLGILYMTYHENRLLQMILSSSSNGAADRSLNSQPASSLLGASNSRPGKRHLMVTTMEHLIGPLLDSYRSCADGILKRNRKGEYGVLFLALDCLANFINQMASTRKKKKEELRTGSGAATAKQASDKFKSINIRDLGVDWEETFRNCGQRSNDLNVIISEFTLLTTRSLAEFIEDIHSATTKSSSLPDDGTVHELTSNTITLLKRLADYLDVVEILCHLARSGNEWTANIQLGGENGSDDIISKLAALRDQSKKIIVIWQAEHVQQRSNTATSVAAASAATAAAANNTANTNQSASVKFDVDLFKMTSSRQYFMDCIGSLLTNLETKAKNYKKSAIDRVAATPSSVVAASTAALQSTTASPKSIQATIFLINNYHYVLRALRSNKMLLMIVGKEFELEVEKKLTAELALYQQFLQPLAVLLMDTTYVKDGSIVTQMSKTERGQIKDRFKKFNDDFEEFHRLQRRFTVPDTELCNQIIGEVSSTLLPMYQRFLQKYENSDFSSHKEKYLRFDVETVRKMIGEFFRQ